MDRLVQPQRARAVRPRGRGGGRLLDAPARQDGHDHARQPPGRRVPPAAGRAPSSELADAAQLSSLADETPEGRSIVVLAKERYGLRERELARRDAHPVHRADAHERRRHATAASIRKGAADAIRRWVEEQGGTVPAELGDDRRRRSPPRGGTPLVVAENGRALGVVHLKDVVKEGMRERFDELRAMGIRTVMITGDNPLTAKAIAEEAGRRRLPRRGDARGQDGADQARAGRRQPRRDDRRRHERRARARPGRRRRGDEHRHAGGARRPATWSTSTRTRRS